MNSLFRYETKTRNECTVTNKEECKIVTTPSCKDVKENVCTEEIVKKTDKQCRTVQKEQVDVNLCLIM